MRRLLFATALLAVSPAHADQRFAATLAGHAVLPAVTFVAPPAGAPQGFATTGRFTGSGNARNDQVGSQPGDPGLACTQGTQGAAERPCFPLPAQVNGVYVIDLGAT